jgi:hypothetical protein
MALTHAHAQADKPPKDETEEERMLRLEMEALAAEQKAQMQAVSLFCVIATSVAACRPWLGCDQQQQSNSSSWPSTANVHLGAEWWTCTNSDGHTCILNAMHDGQHQLGLNQTCNNLGLWQHCC